MPLILGLTALLAAVAPALATYSDGQYTETIGAQEVGTTTIDGSMVYSMNYCTIIHSTRCHTSLSTGGPAPYQTPSSGSAPGYSPPAPTYGQPGTASSGESVPIPTPSTVSSSGSIDNPTVTTSVGGDYTTTSSEEGSTSTTPPEVPNGGAAMGAAAVIGNVLVAAVAVVAL